MVLSLYSGVSGMRNHQTRMDVIGNNIANVNTYGFKSANAIFKDVYYQTAKNPTGGTETSAGNNPGNVGYGVQLAGIVKDMSQSNLMNTFLALDLAISGDGFFITAKFPGDSRVGELDDDGNLAVRGTAPTDVSYTRMGMLTIDSFGNLTDMNNRFILGTLNTAEGLRLTGDDSARAMNNVNPPYRAGELTYDNRININELVQEAFSIYTDVNGLLYTRIDPDTGELSDDPDVGWYVNRQGEYLGDPPEQMDPNEELTEEEIRDLIADEAAMIGELTFKDVSSFEIGTNGVITVSLNNRFKALARIELAVFNNNDGLMETGNTAFRASAASGEAFIQRPGVNGAGVIDAGKLEMSNVNLAKEFSDMIVTQRGFQANSRIITVSDTMLEELINLKR